jgi:hypothetical protein
MKPESFDGLIKRLGTPRVSRLTALRALLGAAVAGHALVAVSDGATAVDFEGCSPRYWKKSEHLDSWAVTGYSPTQTLESVFDVPDAFGLDNDTLLKALGYRVRRGPQRAARKLLRAAVAALLNAAHQDVDYPRTVSTVISAVNAALASNDREIMLNLAANLNDDNTRGCPLT